LFSRRTSQQSHPWIYRYRAQFLDNLGDAELTDALCMQPLMPDRGDKYDEALYARLAWHHDAGQ